MIIVGGESGPGARPFDLAWARSVVEQCRAAGCAAFVKQLGARPFDTDPPAGMGRPLLPGTENGRPIDLKDRKGGDMAEWDADLRVREFPTVRP